MDERAAQVPLQTSMITNKNFGCHEAQLPLYDSHFEIVNSVSINILLIIFHIFCMQNRNDAI